MVTKYQAINFNTFHSGLCTRDVGPRGGVTEHVISVRRNGQTKTWKTRPDEFSVPVKYGLYGYGYITDRNAAEFHISTDCPLDRWIDATL